MNQYLLLRDNKQSGPYSVAELEAKGLKPYDLVWQEGKSAAWRYPSEMEDLKHFAPIVEEQPYDRFYKKPGAETKEVKLDTPLTKVNSAKTEANRHAFVQQPAGKISRDNKSKVYVTLPATVRAVEPAITKQAGRSEDLPASSPSRYNRYEVTDNNISTTGQYAPENGFGTKSHIDQREKPARFAKADSQKILLRSLAAAALLLAGILLGMFFMSQTQQKNMKQLDALVEQINERNQKQAALSNTSDNRTPDSHQASTVFPIADEIPAAVEPEGSAIDTAQQIIQAVTLKKPNQLTKKKEEPSTTPITAKEDIVVPAVLPVAEPERRNEVPRELALKNLFQLVQLKGNNYKTGLLGGISNLQLTIVNRSLYQLENVEVEVEYLGPENKVVKRQTIAFKDIPPGEELMLEVPKSSRGVSVNYAIRQIKSNELGITRRN